MSNKTTKTLSIVLGAAFATTLAASNVANAAGANPFAMTNLDGGYQVASEGKCGGNMDKGKKMDGKCGSKMKDGKNMGEGKCGGDKAKKMEGKCGGSDMKNHKDMKGKDGKCGGDMKGHKDGKKMGKEGKCGEGKCGGK